MFERFTRATRRAVEQGVTIARDAHATEVRPDHVLSALLADEESTAARAIGGGRDEGPEVTRGAAHPAR